MNARLKKSFQFSTGIIYDGRFCVNHYDCRISMLTISDDHHEQNIAYERTKAWIHQILDDSILVSQTNPMLESLSKIGATVIVLPCDPVDQIVGIMLYLKLNAVMENRIVVTEVEVSSLHGDHTSYLHSIDESIGPDFQEDGWWIDPRPIFSTIRGPAQGKIVSLARAPEWKDYELDWNSQSGNNDSVVFADFQKDEKK